MLIYTRGSKRPIEVFIGLKQVFIPPLNTSTACAECEMVNLIPDYWFLNGWVKVLSGKVGGVEDWFSCFFNPIFFKK
jgi:hypothetical protein